MTKKVLILSSSYRKGGNSDTLCDSLPKEPPKRETKLKKYSLMIKT